MSYIVILMSFQTIYSMVGVEVGVNTPGPCWTKTLKSLEPRPSVYRELSEPPFNAIKYVGALP